MSVSVLWLFFRVPLVVFLCVIVVLPDLTHLPFDLDGGKGQNKIIT